jgi:hypothetical protein
VLYGYPLDATTQNWLHDCLCEILGSIHASLGAGQAPPEWPAIIPEPYRDLLSTRTGLRDRLISYTRALGRLGLANQNRVLQALNDQNRIGLLLSCSCACEAISDLPKHIQKPVTELFSFAFKLLTPLGLRDYHYKAIFEATEDHVCPFCGCEYFDAPGAPREALDHYLSESKYPFAAANLRNLVPMGNKCNSRYKLAQDILRRNDGTRRRSFDPYNHGRIRICLDNSQPFAGTDGTVPQWQIDFEPNTEEATTWDDVFKVRERYKRDILDRSFNRWLDKFSAWCRSANISIDTDQEIIDAIERYARLAEEEGITDRAFLRAAVFRMLHKHCRQGNQRLVKLIRGVVTRAAA